MTKVGRPDETCIQMPVCFAHDLVVQICGGFFTVCGKYRYELQKKEKEAKKNQKTTQVKEIRLSTFIEEHDIRIKAKTAGKFLKDGDKVKVSLRFRGREAAYKDKGLKVMEIFAAELAEIANIEKKPVFEGRNLSMVLVPKTEK